MRTDGACNIQILRLFIQRADDYTVFVLLDLIAICKLCVPGGLRIRKWYGNCLQGADVPRPVVETLNSPMRYHLRHVLLQSFACLVLCLFAGLTGTRWLAAQPFAVALDPEKTLTQYLHDVWQDDEGLPQNTVEAILQTADGYLWLGTHEGLVRFDGVEFKVFDKSNTLAFEEGHTIMALLEDRAGALWVGTNGGGLIRFSKGRFTLYGADVGLASQAISAGNGSPRPQSGLPNHSITLSMPPSLLAPATQNTGTRYRRNASGPRKSTLRVRSSQPCRRCTNCIMFILQYLCRARCLRPEVQPVPPHRVL